MSKNNELDITQTSDFHCLLELMLPLYAEEEFAWLPELFSIVGYEKLLLLAKYAGGETIKIPTLDQINFALQSLDWYYLVYICKKKKLNAVPKEYLETVNKIRTILNVR